jgi:beta-lactam-binding protein with PASTA domain
LQGRFTSSPIVVACLLLLGAGVILVQAPAGHGRTAGASAIGPAQREVPYVVGLPILKAALELQRQGFRVSIPRGFTYGPGAPMPSTGSQSLPSGTKVASHTVITLTPHAVCCGEDSVHPSGVVQMPQLLSRGGSEAIRSLIVLGLPWLVHVRPVDSAENSILTSARVVDQWPAAGEPYPPGNSELPRAPTIPRVPTITVDYGVSTNP